MLERSAKVLIPTAVVAGGMAAGVVDFNIPAWAVDMMKQWGPGGVLLAGFAWYVPRSSVKDFFQSQKDQAVALAKVGDGMERIAGQETRLEQVMAELGINQRVTIARLGRIEELIIDGRKISEPGNPVAPASDPARS